jgi:AraC family transcriptional regulator
MLMRQSFVILKLLMDNRNFILTGQARQYFWKGEGLCSVKTFQRGPAYYNTGKGSFKVEEDQFLLLNEGTFYAIEIDNYTPVHSFCLFFERRLVQTVLAERGRSMEYLLENIHPLDRPEDFVERTYPLHRLHPTLLQIHSRQPLFGTDPVWLEQECLQVLQVLEGYNAQSLQQQQRLSAVKPSTRREMFERLLKALEFLHANYERPLSLHEVASHAALSVNQLLRGFKAAFQTSPLAYLTELRLTKAERLLKQTDDPVATVVEAIGWVSVPSFSLLFKKRTGLSPEMYRKQKR